MPKKNNNDSEFEAAGTKISAEALRRIDAISEKKGISRYALIQMMCDVIIRYMDDRHNLTPLIERLMTIFEHLNGWQKAFNLADYTAQPEIIEAIYFFTDEQKRGVRAVHVERPWLEGTDQWTQTYNLQQIFDRFLELLMPERYHRLMMLGRENNCASILELIDYLLDEHSKDAELALLRMEFEDAARSDFGKKPADAPFRRKHYKSVNDDRLTDRRQLSLFDMNDEQKEEYDFDSFNREYDINNPEFGHQ